MYKCADDSKPDRRKCETAYTFGCFPLWISQRINGKYFLPITKPIVVAILRSGVGSLDISNTFSGFKSQ
jgi:hypothetical protein